MQLPKHIIDRFENAGLIIVIEEINNYPHMAEKICSLSYEQIDDVIKLVSMDKIKRNIDLNLIRMPDFKQVGIKKDNSFIKEVKQFNYRQSHHKNKI